MKKKKISNKISYVKPIDAIMLFVVFCMFIFLIVTVNIGTTRYKKSQIQMIQNSMEVLAGNQKVQFEQYVDNKVSLLQGLTKFPEIYEMDMEEQKKLLKGHSAALGFHHLFIQIHICRRCHQGTSGSQ